MSDNRWDSACCSSSNSNAENVNNSTDSFEIGNWNSEEGSTTGLMNDNETVSVTYINNAIRLEFPKFSKGFKESDFREFVRKYVGEENFERLENGKYPNLWIMFVKNQEICESLLRIWKTKIKNKTCWINPYYENELRGFLHWLPHFIPDDDVKRQLSQYGDVLFVENEIHDYWNAEIKSEVKYFGLRLEDGMVKNDLPHFLKFNSYRTLVIVRGRQPACFHCREFGHNKKDCMKYKERLDEYCKNPESRKPRTKPRGRRHRPDCDYKHLSEDNRDQNEAYSSSRNVEKDSKIVESCLKHEYSERRSIHSKKMEDILPILRSLNEWKEKTREVVEQNLKNIEENSNMYLNSMERTESEAKENPIKYSIEITKLLEDMKQITNEKIEQILNYLKNVVTDHFGIDCIETLENLIGNFEPKRREKLGPTEVKSLEEQALSYVF